MITVLCGGVGAARLLQALVDRGSASDLTAVVNVGDDLVLHGLSICPDLDTIAYTLAGMNNDELGWGLQNETWHVMDALTELGGEDWFRLGDRDLATHLYRSQRLGEGATKTEVTSEICRRLGVAVRLLPVSDATIATVFDTELGRLSFQEYFVRHRHAVRVSSITVQGAREASPTRETLHALRDAERIVIAPSNPLISIDPILQVGGVRALLSERRDDVMAISPIVGGAALKGPADQLLSQLGYEASCVGVADFYRGIVGTLVIDEVDADRADDVRERGMKVIVTSTVMAERENAQRLARAVLE
ncbi:MAG TPA: 2-phospho-L-lactate transferase [Acidimicrobiales bacterium]|nr:2-phospho-L-lactate transferase [Acidimicrobiales bacterium]